MTQENDHSPAYRPRSFEDYIGQEQIIKTLRMFLDATKQRGMPNEHILFYGPPGIGKTTLAHIIARELQGELKITTGAAITKGGDLAAILTNLQPNDVLFIDEIHRLPKPVEEILYPVLEEYSLDIVIGKGPGARTVRIEIPRVTIIGATTKLALLSAPLRDRFRLLLRLDFYTDHEIVHIVKKTSERMQLTITDEAAKSIALRSRKTPRIANRILKRARDMVDIKGISTIDEAVVTELFTLLELDEMGLSDIDKKYLHLIGKKFRNQPIGVETIASSLSEDKRTIEEFIEPYLLQIGFITKTPRGRKLTYTACKHMNISIQEELVLTESTHEN